MTASRGYLIALEGIDGCGKSTQARILADRLNAVLTFEPGATPLGASLRTLLLERDGSALAPRAEALLMAADRAQHVDEVIRPALDSGRSVVTDRFAASTLAYQGYGRGLNLDSLAVLVRWATGDVVPDVTVLLDLPVTVAATRRLGGRVDRMEAEGSAFLQRVADGFQVLSKGAGTWVVVDATAPVDDVAAVVWDAVSTALGTGRSEW